MSFISHLLANITSVYKRYILHHITFQQWPLYTYILIQLNYPP